MSSINKVILIGHLGKDPEIRYTTDKVAVAKFSLATTETYRDKSGNRTESTEWHNIVAWRGLAEVAEKYLTKGKQIYIEGKIKTRSWDDKEGNKRYITEIIADNFVMLGSKGQQDNHEIKAHEDHVNEKLDVTPPPVSPEIEDDLPF